MTEWTNEAAIEQWATFPRAALDAMEPYGDFAKQHLLNPALLRLLGDVRGRRLLDAGCGHGYLSRMLAGLGAEVTGAEPAAPLIGYAREKEAERGQGIRYVQADLSSPLDLDALGGPFDAVVCSNVLQAVPDWTAVMASCVAALAGPGRFVFALVHPCFEQLSPSWREHGEYRVREYLADYEIPGPHATDFHRPLSAYLNEVIRLGGRLREVAEPALDPATGPGQHDLAEAYVRFPNFLVAVADF
jgi:2-polyprenyl-3-methyl-5-hydroxy-6-metoxy-1,4-benzoquinol methylase